MKRYLDRVEDWTGRLSSAQRDLVRARVSAMEDLTEEWLGDRRFRQSETIALLRARPPREAVTASLTRSAWVRKLRTQIRRTYLPRIVVLERKTRRLSLTPMTVSAHQTGGVDLSRLYALHFTSGADALEVARAFAGDAEVEYAEPQFVYPLAALANDPLYAAEQSAYFERMQFPAAHDVTRGEAGDVVIDIVDGGSEWRHPDLAANVWSNPGESLNGLDDDGNGFVDDVRGWNFSNGTNDPTGLAQTPSAASHGTHVAGIACAVSDNGVGVAGATWNARFARTHPCP